MNPISILVVEDDRIIIRGISKRLTTLGYRVAGLAYSGLEAVDRCRECKPDLVLMDINLGPGIDGIEAALRIGHEHDVPIVFLTAHSDLVTLERAKLTSPLGYVLKPYQDADLQTSIEIALHRHGLERQLRESQEWLSATLGSMGDGVISTDAGGKVRSLNHAAERLLGWSQEQAFARDIEEILILRGETGEALDNPVRFALGQGVRVSPGGNKVLVAPTGAEIVINDTVAPIRDAEGVLAGAVLVLRDVTERWRLERELETERLARVALIDELREKNEKLERINEQKDFVLGMAAHDLRNPLGIVLGYTEFLQDQGCERIEPGKEAYLDRIYRAASGMLTLVEDLLDVSALESGKLTLELTSFDLQSLVRSLVELQTPLAAAKRLALSLSLFETPLRVRADLGKVEQVINNLLSNAIKYSYVGSAIQVEVARVETEVEVRVTDLGPGISGPEKARLFEPFGVTSARPTGGEKSTGLGLAIARRIVEGHQGSIGASSRLGEGSTFWFRLPLEKLAAVSLETAAV